MDRNHAPASLGDKTTGSRRKFHPSTLRHRNRVKLFHLTAKIKQGGIDVGPAPEDAGKYGIIKQPGNHLRRRGKHRMVGAQNVRQVQRIFVVSLRLEKRALEIFSVSLVFEGICCQLPGRFPGMLLPQAPR